MKTNFLILIILIFCNSCNSVTGTLGSFQKWIIPVSIGNVDEELIKLYANNPEYVIPEKWKYMDSWKDRGFEFLDGTIFYFKANPEEIYYVTYSDAEEEMPNTVISVRAVFNKDVENWQTIENYRKNEHEKKRINERFYQEIIAKLEKQMNVKSKKLNYWYEFLE